MRQISIILATAVVTAIVTVAGMMAISSSSPRAGAVVRASTPIDVMKMMKDVKDLNQWALRATGRLRTTLEWGPPSSRPLWPALRCLHWLSGRM